MKLRTLFISTFIAALVCSRIHGLNSNTIEIQLGNSYILSYSDKGLLISAEKYFPDGGASLWPIYGWDKVPSDSLGLKNLPSPQMDRYAKRKR